MNRETFVELVGEDPRDILGMDWENTLAAFLVEDEEAEEKEEKDSDDEELELEKVALLTK